MACIYQFQSLKFTMEKLVLLYTIAINRPINVRRTIVSGIARAIKDYEVHMAFSKLLAQLMRAEKCCAQMSLRIWFE